MAKIIDFGKNKGLILADCGEKYLKWLVSHEKVLALRNRWASRDARFILEKKEAKTKMAHSNDILELLEQYGELEQKDISSYMVYGSPCRPLSASWVQIPDAIIMNTDKIATYYNYVAVPTRLDRETRDSYELSLVSRP
ncbi:MAG TPA: hypothetical protein VHV10_15540 [Ktedonobacteraceae bacterium]|nr:hypothetical protein [Ktedonobacteraceae bacterium]